LQRTGAISRHIAPDMLFFGGGEVQRGRDAVLAAWKPYFEGPTAPFSWEPDQVEVLNSGQLALSCGPVRDPGAKSWRGSIRSGSARPMADGW
jgi:ketosteroid isomerase-like protein